jgi:hypothetical protein
MGAFAPVDNTQVIGGFARVLLSIGSYPNPSRIGEIVDLTGSPVSYAAKTTTYGWIDIGTTKSPSRIAMQTANAEWRGEQQGPIRTLYTDTTGTASFELEEMLNTAAVRAAANGVAEAAADPLAGQHRQDWVAPDSVGFTRLCFLRKDPDGRLHATVATKAQWDGSQLQRTFSRAESESLTFNEKLYPDPSNLSASGKPIVFYDLWSD